MGVEEKHIHILFVEDSKDDREMYGHYLALKGFRLSTASDGREGLEKAFRLKPDVVLMDLWLPEIGGWEATLRLKSDERTKHIPVVIITGHEFARQDLLNCEGWLTKPCPPDDLQGAILQALERCGQSGDKPH